MSGQKNRTDWESVLGREFNGASVSWADSMLFRLETIVDFDGFHHLGVAFDRDHRGALS